MSEQAEPLIVAVCCFKGEHYRWFDLPRPMTKRDARQWATDNVGTPAENFRTPEHQAKLAALDPSPQPPKGSEPR